MSATVAIMVAVLGGVVGRVASVAVEQVPLEEPGWRSPLVCGACGGRRSPVGWVPVLGPLLGRCSSCDERAPVWEAAQDAVMAGCFGLMALRFDHPANLAAYLVLAASLVTLSAIDLQTMRLPDRLTVPTFVAGTVLLGGAAVVTERTEALVPALVGAAAYFGILLVTHVIYPRGMGFGDVKLAAPMGLYLGYLRVDALEAVSLVLYAMLMGFAAGSVAGVLVVAVRRRSVPYPFGPFLAAGTLAAVVLSRSIGR